MVKCTAIAKQMSTKKRKVCLIVYLLALGLGFGLAFGFGFCVSSTGFIGSPQQTTSHGSHSHPPHGFSTAITSPHSSHLYLSPFSLAKN
jgi:hypothetical protein